MYPVISPELIRIYDQLAQEQQKETAEDRVHLLQWLVLLRHPGGLHRVIAAIRQPLSPESGEWYQVFLQYDPSHPDTKRVLRELSSPLPPDQAIGLGYVGCANRFAKSIAGKEEYRHPFDSEEGRLKLEQWFRQKEKSPYYDGFTIIAIEALPFLSESNRNPLLKLASGHANLKIQAGAAWVGASLGDGEGVVRLTELAKDFRCSTTATIYLNLLGLEMQIPKESKDPEFRAKATLSDLLSKPMEFGRVPSELEVIDRRKIKWPMDKEAQERWLIRWVVPETLVLSEGFVGVGMVGEKASVNFIDRSDWLTEDYYAIYAYLDMLSKGLLKEIPSNAQSNSLERPKTFNGEPLSKVTEIMLISTAPELKYLSEKSVLYLAQKAGKRGWLVVEGRQSTWYDADGVAAVRGDLILEIHVGRRVLGLKDEPNRKMPEKEPLKNRLTAEETIAAYEQLIAIAKNGNAEEKEEVLDPAGPLYRFIEDYGKTLKEKNQGDRIDELLNFLEPHWRPYEVEQILGRAAYSAGRWDLAAKYFQSAPESDISHWNNDLLAEILHSKGDSTKAKELLMSCLTKTYTEAKASSGRGRIVNEEIYQKRLAVLKQLFPGEADSLLKSKGLSETTLGDE